MLRKSMTVLLATLAPFAALAQFKVVQPDGTVTYTDRPPVPADAKVSTINRRGEAAPLGGGAGLPYDLQRVASRYPVTLFTTEDCPPCDSGRQLLQQRGVPYTERTVSSAEDAAALERMVGGRTVPALQIGGQGLRGFEPADWTSYLNAAGYPKTSRLPRGWQPPPPAPLVARTVAPNPLAESAAPAPAREVPVVPKLEAERIRF